MIIKKDGALAKTLKKILKRNNTGNVSTLLNNLMFEKGKGITLYLTEGINSIIIKDDSVDFNANITNSFVITALSSELEKDDVLVTTQSSNVIFNDYSFENTPSDEETIIKKRTPFITFNQEQFNKLEKDFELTVGNYFKSSRATDVICFAFKEGKLYKLLPGCNVYEISKFDGTVDDVELEKEFGHSICAYIMQHVIFDIMKNEQSVSISFEDNIFYIDGNEIMVTAKFTSNSFGTNVFVNSLALINDNESFATLKDFSSLKEKVKRISSNLFEEAETPNIFVKAENNKINAEIENVMLSFDTDTKNNFIFGVDLLAFDYVLQNLPENTTVSKNNYFLIFKTENKTIFILNRNF